MIQRIQTVYVFVAGFIILILFSLNLADILVNNELMRFNAKGIFKGDVRIFNGLPLMLLIAIIGHLQIIAIFLYKKRIRQIRILVFNSILMFGLFGLFIFFAYSGFDGAKINFKIPVAFPIVGVILNYLAIRAIGKDEALIRSLNRLR